MKTNIFLTILITWSLTSCVSQNKIKLYKVKLKANEILGTGHVWGPAAGENKTEDFTRASNGLNELLGLTYTTDNMYATRNFLNMAVDRGSPILDSINYSFYDIYGFLKLEAKEPTLLNDDKYVSFKCAFKDDKINNK